MSACNAPERKLARRLARYQRRARARRGLTARGTRIPHQGVIVTRGDVKRHRYLAERGLPHSESVARVALPTRVQRRAEANVAASIVGAVVALAGIAG